MLLERPPHVFACEISVTTTIDHEFGNVLKCLKADLPNVVIITSEERLPKIKTAVETNLGAELSARVLFFRPEDFLRFLESLPAEVPKPADSEENRRGYKVKRSFVKLSREELKQKEDGSIQMIAETMKRKPVHRSSKI